jgi:hypothetical protein
LAFSVQNAITKELLYDPSLIRFQGIISEGDGLKQYQNIQEIGVHPCSHTDFKKMYTPATNSKRRIERLQYKDSLFCLNDTDVNGRQLNLNLFGMDTEGPHRRLEIIVMPCLTYRGWTETGYVQCKEGEDI